jgi:hypothetical protein
LKPNSKFWQARGKLAKVTEAERLEAELLAVLMEHHNADGMFEEALRSVYAMDPGDLHETITRALGKSPTAMTRTIGAVYFWNAVILYRARDLSGYSFQAKSARKQARLAMHAEPDIEDDYTFLKGILDQRVPKFLWRPKPSRKSPETAAGFRWGMTEERARARCKKHEFSWSGSGARFTCHGVVPDLGFDGETVLTFCDKRLCQADVFHTPKVASSSGWSRRIGGLNRMLGDWFGKPKRRKAIAPKACTGKLHHCLNSGRANFDYSWSWEKAERSLRFSVGPKGGKATLRLRFVDEKLAKRSKK